MNLAGGKAFGRLPAVHGDGTAVVLALAVPFLRDFYELSTPTVEAVGAWAAGVALGVGGMLGALRLLHV